MPTRSLYCTLASVLFVTVFAFGVVPPPRLQAGATVGVSCPAYPVNGGDHHWTEVEFKQHVVSGWNALGYDVKFSKHWFGYNYGYFSGTDLQRASDLMDLFLDKEVHAIQACRGGWGNDRILPLLNFSIIAQHPKPVIGYSDVTALTTAIATLSKVGTFHGPMGLDSYTGDNVKYLKSILEGGTPLMRSTNCTAIRKGKARGKLLGGNLSVFITLIGSPYLKAAEFMKGEYILFLEDVGEYTYSVDRMLSHLSLSGYLKAANGIIFGQCTSCKLQYPDDFTLSQVFEQHFANLNVPVMTGAMFGHISQQFTLPVGAMVEMDTDKGTIQLLEPAVQ